MRKKHHTAILEFEVVVPTNDMETVGEKLELSRFGEYCADVRGYQLFFLLQHPYNYRISKIIMKGETRFIANGERPNPLPSQT